MNQFPRSPPMWGFRVGFMGVKEHEFPRNEMGIVETSSPKSRSPATGLRPGFASSRVIVACLSRSACVIPLGDGEDVFR